MGWHEKGKRGVHSGRTLRRNANHRRDHGVLSKYKENTGAFPNSVTKSLLQDRYGLTDGLHLSHTPHRQNADGVEFSLGKRKRWLLFDLVKERVLEEDLDDEENLEDTEELHLCFHERHIFHDNPRSRGDCVSAFSDHDGDIYPNHRYSFYSDIRKKDTKPPEVGYEICTPPCPNAWPNFKESQNNYYSRFWDLAGHKSKSKCKGIRNKGDRFGLQDYEDDYELVRRKSRRSKTVDYKVKSVSKKDFQFAAKNMNKETRKCTVSFDLDEFTVNPAMKGNNVKSPDTCTSPKLKKYGKGCAIFVENDPMEPVLVKVPQEIQQKSYINVQHKVNISFDVEQIEPQRLSSEWGHNYREGTVSPRKFAINITTLLPNSKLKANSISHILFELHGQSSKGKAIAGVSLVHASVGQKSELVIAAKDFATYIKRVKDSCETWQVNGIVQAAVQCIRVMKDLPEETLDRPIFQTSRVKSVLNLNLLNSLCNWESEAYSLQEAQQQIKGKLEKEAKNPEISNATCMNSHWSEFTGMVAIECGICYVTFEGDSITSLTECGHSFCNECWAGHVETQVTQGIGHVKCPGYDCDCMVDSITMMCLNPLLYERYMNTRVSKYLETSPKWKWCPGKYCQRLVKATGSNQEGMTVLCSCTTAWCFKCKQRSHWPATCIEAAKFQEISREVENAITMESQEFVSSVMVKNCPQCNYPIEKFYGCQFMHCVLCHAHFCWNCVTVATYGHNCEKVPTDDLNEVFKSKKYQIKKYVEVVLYNTKARKPSLLFAKTRKLEKLEAGQSSVVVLPGNNSRVSRFVKNTASNEALKLARDTAEFEFQARVVVEGLAIKAAISKAQVGKTAMRKMSQLLFITERADSLLKEPHWMCKDERISCLKRLVEVGTECIMSLKDISNPRR